MSKPERGDRQPERLPYKGDKGDKGDLREVWPDFAYLTSNGEASDLRGRRRLTRTERQKREDTSGPSNSVVDDGKL
jgi:hypothetical protein